MPDYIRRRLSHRSFLQGLATFVLEAPERYYAQADYGVIATACQQAAEVRSDLLRTLRRPLSLKWAAQAACLDHDPSLWEPAESRHQKKRRHIEKAKRICWQQCPVREDCLGEALVHGTPGIRGGYEDWERESVSVVRIAKKIRND